MPTIQKIQTNNGEVEIEVRPINLIYQNPVAAATNPQLKYPNCVRLTPEYTIYHAERVSKLHVDFEAGWRVFCNNTNPRTPVTGVTADNIRNMGMAAIHLMGLIDMTLKLFDKNVRVVWVYPETYMHPGWQVGLGDLVIWFSKRTGEYDAT